MSDPDDLLERASEVSRDLDAFSIALLRAIRAGARDAVAELLAGPTAIAVRGDLERIASKGPR